jgi:hypothetical protein
MSKAAELAALIGSQTALSNRNIIINGAMAVSQRATSFSETTAATYTTDRWLRHVGNSFNFDTTITQSTTVPAGTGLPNSLKVAVDTAVTPSGSDNAGMGQRIEGNVVKQLAYGAATGKSATLSFWVRSNKTGTYTVMFGMNNGSSTSSEKYLHVKEYTISSANTWEHKEITLPANTVQALTTTTTEGFRIVWWLAVGSSDHVSADTWIQSDSYSSTSNQVNFMDNTSNEWYLTGCQFELGEQATPFEHRSFGDELARCQRYYEKYEYTGSYHHIMNGMANSTLDEIECPFYFMTTKRTPPTLSFSSDGTFRLNGHVGADQVCNGIATSQGTEFHIRIIFSKATANLTAGAASYINTEADNDATIEVDAEL